MNDRARKVFVRAAAIGVAVLAVGMAGYGLYLVLIGPESTVMPAVPLGTPPGETTTRTVPAMQGLIPLAGGALVLVGLATRRLWLAWAGALVLALFAGLFVFGVGGVLIPFVGALLLLLSIVSWAGTPKQRITRGSTTELPKELRGGTDGQVG
jgi:hypothetical protein